MQICDDCDIPATPIYTLAQVVDHPQLNAVGLFSIEDHPSEGRIRTVRPTTKFAQTPAAIRSPAPLHGQHTDEVLREAGFAEAEIAALHTPAIPKD